MFAEIAFPISSYQTFTYRVPDALQDEVSVGVRVKAPLGRRQAQGIITGLAEESQFKGKTRSLSSVVDPEPVLDQSLWELITWMSRYYATPLGQVAHAALPNKLSANYSPPTRWTVKFRRHPDNPETLRKRAPVQARVLEYIAQFSDPVSMNELGNMASSPLTICRELDAKDYVELTETIHLPDITGFTFAPVHKDITFNDHQNSVLTELTSAINSKKFAPSLLHGVTGSGKTEIYIEIARQVLAQKRSVILLLPEIALTPQIAGRFRATFGDDVALWHSKLTAAVRAWTWKRICQGQFKVIIGARSAVFAPVKNLGLIVIDEEQETAYKQESPAPRYHARDVALMRGKISQATVVLASATPSLESYYNHIQGKFRYLHLPERFGGAKYPHVHVVDMTAEKEESGKIEQIFSGLLLDKIESRLTRKEQVILLQNRRGYAPILRCRDCGAVEMCPHCQISLTYHRVGENLRCHLCGYERREIPTACPQCDSPNLRLFGTGTQKVEDLLQETFTRARITRLDVDTTRSGRTLTKALQDFSEGKIDILLGTQMIAKGLDFAKATLVGIINGDTGLFLPDFRSGERIFQLIYQASGRAGRADLPGEVVVQTYSPDNPVIKHATRLDLKTYYNIALNERQALNYPPFSWLAKLEINGKQKSRVEAAAKQIRSGLRQRYRGLDILGPAFCYRERLRSQYRMQIVFRSRKDHDPNGAQLQRFLQSNFGAENKNRRKAGAHSFLDVNPVSLL